MVCRVNNILAKVCSLSVLFLTSSLSCRPAPADFLPPIPDGVYKNPFGRLITYTQLRDRVVAGGRLVEGNPEDTEGPLYYEFEHAGVTYGAVIDVSAVSICPQSEGLGRCWQSPFFVCTIRPVVVRLSFAVSTHGASAV